MRYLCFVSFKENNGKYGIQYAYITRYGSTDMCDRAFDYFKRMTGKAPQVYLSPDVVSYDEALSYFAMGNSKRADDIKQAIKEFNTVEYFNQI